jgi:hypothetical protein
MEIHQFEPLCLFHQRTGKNTQTRPSDSTHRELAPRPTYKLSKLFTNKINHIAVLPNAFNVKNTKELIQNLKDTP